MDSLAYAKKYRPRRFQDVYGQDHPMRLLSNLIRRGQRGRDLLLHGTVGSGKTTLARLYGRALNCDKPDDHGSPCNISENCSVTDTSRYDNPDESTLYQRIGFFEYDTPKEGGTAKNVSGFLDKSYHFPLTRSKWRILFFDEAHFLKDDGASLLLKSVEGSRQDIIYLFATTEPRKLLRALRSRLLPVEVKPLPPESARKFLAIFADKEGIEYEPEALALLAGLKQGYPRDLLTGLEQVADPESRLTVEKVQRIFDVGQRVALLTYFEALADGDFNRQIEIISAWQDPRREVIRWIQAFLTAIYYNNILETSAVVDAIMRSISDRERAPVLDKFCKRFRVSQWIELRPIWRKMLAFWQISDSGLNDTVAMLRITLFQDLVNDAARPDELAGPDDSKPLSTWQPTLRDEQTSAIAPEFTDIVGYARDSDPSFLRLEDIRTIINHASFLIQEYESLFNIAFDVDPAVFGIDNDEDALLLIEAFCRQLEERARLRADCLFALIAVRERNGTSITASVLVHVSGRSDDPAELGFSEDAVKWAGNWRSEQFVGSTGETILSRRGPVDDTPALNFHWRETMKLCAGMDASLKALEPTTSLVRPLSKLLGVRNTRPSGAVPTPIVSLSGCLRKESMEASCRPGLAFLSAFDMRAWSHLRTGWERDEHGERVELRRQRQLELKVTEEMHGRGSPEIKELEDSWAMPPKRRQRSWRVWWREGEA